MRQRFFGLLCVLAGLVVIGWALHEYLEGLDSF